MLRFILLLTLTVYIVRPGEWLIPGDIRWNLILNIVGALALAITAATRGLSDRADRTWAYLAAFFAWMILSTTFNAQFEKYSTYFTDMLTVLLIFMLVGASISTERHARTITVGFTCLMLFVSYQCYLQLQDGTNWAGAQPIQRNAGIIEETGQTLTVPQVRWIGVFYDPNDTGMLLASLAPLAFASALFLPRNIFARLMSGAVFLVLVYTIYLTNSRGTFLALLAAIGMFFIVKYRSVIGLVLAGVAGTTLLAIGPARMSGAVDDSSMERVYTWILSLHLLPQYPVFGIGPHNWSSYHHLTTHNSFVLAMVETGVIGYSFYLAVFLIALYVSAMVALKSPEKEVATTAAALIACLTGVLVAAFFISRTYVVLPFFISALVIAYCRALAPAIYNDALADMKYQWLLATALASIVLLWFINILATSIAY